MRSTSTSYINFDAGKSNLKADGEATVKKITAMLKAARAMKISIEGHTDKVGIRPQAGNSARPARRPSWTPPRHQRPRPNRPIADNRTEDGKAKNRRVELVKQK